MHGSEIVCSGEVGCHDIHGHQNGCHGLSHMENGGLDRSRETGQECLWPVYAGQSPCMVEV